MRTGAKKLVFTSTTSQCSQETAPVLVSDEKHRAHTCRYGGDGGEGSTLFQDLELQDPNCFPNLVPWLSRFGTEGRESCGLTEI